MTVIATIRRVRRRARQEPKARRAWANRQALDSKKGKKKKRK